MTILDSVHHSLKRRSQGSDATTQLLWSGLLTLFLSLVLATAPTLHSQAIYGSINGTVTDSSGAVVPGATITVTDIDKGTEKVETTNGVGIYYVHSLIPDRYVVKVEASGFATAKSNTIAVKADSTVVFDVKLTVGASAQSVIVTTAAPELTVDRAEVATQLDTQTLVNAPNILRNVTALVLLAPATTSGTFYNAPAEDPQRSIMVSANGQSPEAAGFVLDGANDKDSFIGEIVINPPLDSIQETKFINQNYDAEFGSAIAGITVMQTKSGSNNFHGSAYDFRHSDAQQARDPFTQYPHNNLLDPVKLIYGPDVPHTLSNKFGGSIGGPVIKEKLFFFGDYQGTREKSGSSFYLTVPTALVHSTCTGTGTGNCDLSEYLAANGPNSQVYDPAQGTLNADGANTGVGRSAFAGNLIPNTRLSPQAINALKLIPLPTLPGIANNFVGSGFALYNFDQFDTRVDWQAKDRLHVFGRYGYLGSNQKSSPALGQIGGSGFGSGGWAGTETGGNHSLAIGADKVITPKLFTDVRVYWLKYAFVEAKYNGTSPMMNDLGWAGLNTSAWGSGGAAQIAIDGMSTLGSGNHGATHCACPLDMNQQEWGVVNNWTHDMGHHSVKFGADLRRVHQLRVTGDTNRTGELAFTGQRTALGLPGNATLGGLGVASFLFGDVSTMSRYFSTNTDAAETQYRTFFYVQDNWRVTQKLTLNLGGRWEIYWPESVNGKGNGGFWNTQTDMIQVAGYGNVNLSANVKNNYRYLEPRIGITYQPTSKSVIRAGLGRSEDAGYWGNIFGGVLTQTIPVLQNQSFSQRDNLGTDAARLANGKVYNVAVSPDTPVSAYSIPSTGMFLLPLDQAPQGRTNRETVPDIFGWNASYQTQLTNTMDVTVSYVANKGTHTVPGGTGWAGVNFNDPPMSGFIPNASGNTPPCNSAPFFLKFNTLYNDGKNECGQGWYSYYPFAANSHYHSLQVVLAKRFSQGLQFQSSYVESTTGNVVDSAYFVQDPHVEWGPYNFNRKHNFKLFGDYDLPFGRGKQFGSNMNGIANAILGGYAIDAVVNWGSGLPYSPSYNECRSDAPHWDMPCRPNQVSGFSQGAGSLNTAGHYVTWFTPVAPLASNGATNGPWQRPQAFTFGTAQADSLFGPGLFTTDMTVRKAITLHEEAKLSLEAQARNVFNHINLANPNSGCIDCSATTGAGRITDIFGGSSSSFGGMRQLQFGAHLTF